MKPCILVLLLAGLSATRASGGSFSTDFNSGTPAGSATYGNALVDSSGGVGDSGVLKLTTANFSQTGSFIVDDLDPGQRIGSFVAAFRLRMGGGTATPGDGVSFNFANNLPNAAFDEEGGGSGLTIVFDAYDNSNGDNTEGPEFRIKSNGALLARRKISNQFRTDTNFVDVQVTYTSAGTFSLSYNNILMYTNFFALGPMDPGARFGFSGRCGGGANQDQFIDDLSIVTTPISRFLITNTVSPSPAVGVSPDTIVTVTLADAAGQVDTNSVALNFNGAAVVPTISKVNGLTTISYDPPGSLPYSSINYVTLSFSYVGDPFRDVLRYDFTVDQKPLWSLAPTSRSYLPLDTDAANGSTPLYRSIAYSALSNHLYIVSRTGPNAGLSVNVLDAATGEDLYQLNTNGIGPSGTIMLAYIAVAEDGAIYATSISATNGVTIYRWADDQISTMPTVAFSGPPSAASPSNTRWGDALAARGAGATTQLILDGNNATNGAVLTATDATATGFTAAGYIHTYNTTGNAIGRQIQFGPTNTYFMKKRSSGATPPVSARTLQLTRYDSSPATTVLLSVPDFYPQVGPVAIDLSKNLAAGILFVTNSAVPDRLIVYDISNLSSPLQIAQYDFPVNHQKNSNFIGEVVFGPDKIFAVDGNNGIVAVPAYPTFLPGLSLSRSGNSTILTWLHSLPEFLVQATPGLSPPAWTTLGIPVTVVGNRAYATNMTTTNAQFYRLIKP